MSFRVGHSSLSQEASRWLSFLSDPQPGARSLPEPIRSIELPILVEAAEAHGVLPAVTRNVQKLAAQGLSRSILDDPDAQDRIETLGQALGERLVIITGQSLLHAHHAGRIAAALRNEAVAASIVKGPVFARRLYPQPADRSFTDIDILVDPASLAPSAAVLERLGFVLAPSKNRDEVDHGEYKWLLPGNDLLLVELQTNLIHSPTLGAGIRLAQSDLVMAGDGDPEDATALFLVAAVHAAAGHQFERLQPAVDALQAVRGAAGPIDAKRLARVARATGSTAAVQTTLDLVARLFDEPAALALAELLEPVPWRRLRRGLVPPGVALRAQARHAGLDSWRRRALRELIRRSGKMTIRRLDSR